MVINQYIKSSLSAKINLVKIARGQLLVTILTGQSGTPGLSGKVSLVAIGGT
jgi:hypothetical protein